MTTAFQFVFDNAETISVNNKKVVGQTATRNGVVRSGRAELAARPGVVPVSRYGGHVPYGPQDRRPDVDSVCVARGTPAGAWVVGHDRKPGYVVLHRVHGPAGVGPLERPCSVPGARVAAGVHVVPVDTGRPHG